MTAVNKGMAESIHKQETEKKKTLGMSQVFWNFKSCSQSHNSSNKVTSRGPFQTVPPTGKGDQAFNIWS